MNACGDKLINIRKIARGFAVEVPHELKGAFKKSFPSAEWSKGLNAWIVGPRSGERLEQWAAAVESVGGELKAIVTNIEERVLTLREVESLTKQVQEAKSRLEWLASQLEAQKDLEQKLKQALQLLEEKKRQIEQLQAEIDRRKEENNAKRAEVDAILSSIIDIKYLKTTALREYCDYYVGQKRNRELFEKAKQRYIEARETLAKAGLELAAINWLASARYHRADRDGPSLMDSNAWYDLSRVEQSNGD